MKFSVAMPAFKPDFFREAIASVVAQTYDDWELVIVDDHSPADLYSIAEPFLSDSRVRYHRNERNFGFVDVVDNWNRSLGYCTGDYVICIGDDDRLLPWCLSSLASLIGDNPGLGLYHIATEVIDEDGRVVTTLESRPGFERSLEMLLQRWRGRIQFIGDFCFDVRRLRSAGGFYKLPLAWGSDDITEYLCAKGDDVSLADGVANLTEPAFQYRCNRLTISSNDNYRVKLEAMMAQYDWFTAELSSRVPRTDRDRESLRLLLEMLDEHFLEYSDCYVRDDIARKKTNVFHWLGHRKDTRLGWGRLMIQIAKGLVS